MTAPEPGRRAAGRVALVVNPSAGKGRAQEVLPEIAGRIRDAGHTLDIWLSRDFGEARELIHKAANSAADVVAVMGGDGILHLGVNEAARAQLSGPSAPTLGLIPAGTGNDLCRGLDIGEDPLKALDVILAGHERQIDLARVGEAFIGTIVATGFDALVNRRANDMNWPKGSARYPLALMAVLRTFQPLQYQLTIDGVRRDLDAMLVAVGNTRSYGGGIRICPDADPSDGLLEVTIIHPVGRPTLLRLMPSLYTGKFVSDPCVELLRVRDITIDGPGLVGFGDGEMIGAAPLTVSQVPAALRVCLPPIPTR
ncbi:diacylglycerol/lipid kinase family protein [Microlunatus soli]|uniref:Diacylglycerol kinase n=1 Tax=Microlunatus soli TaxID=630515 RepID=A0A1H1Y0Y2_9ACTN|nr:YegS/Rv2252/BmrU family lipid kinase [Microlunatus soli]SDT15127.1 diacylglycerol kinase [Microlunatus soli]